VVSRGVKLLVDPMSFQYLAGAEIDYKEDLEGAQFVIRNPNATTTCGCGPLSRPERLPGRPIPCRLLAAVDLGSNSFHMVVARYSHGQLLIVDRLRESVAPGRRFDEQGRLSREAVARALPAWSDSASGFRTSRPAASASSATNTLRKARRKGAFPRPCPREALGHPIGSSPVSRRRAHSTSAVARTTPSEGGHRLVVDIGGGSTELIIGEGLGGPTAREPVHGLRQHEHAALCRRGVTEKRMKRAQHRGPARGSSR